MIRVSAGTAQILGLRKLQSDVDPTTGYFLSGGECRGNCAFCPQGQGHGEQLSRIVWPEYSIDSVTKALRDQPSLQRYCFQTADTAGWLEGTKALLARLQQEGLATPACISCRPHNLHEVEELLSAGADRVSIALDACTPAVAQKVGRAWQSTYELLKAAAAQFPGKMSTHLIIGLGETEREAIELMEILHQQSITVALFAFTPVKGTSMADHPQPPLDVYRRVQAALYLLKHGSNTLWHWTEQDHLSLTKKQLEALRPEAFQTSGCPDCNRPYYNEKPGGVMYNYPRPLRANEFAQCLQELEAVNGS